MTADKERIRAQLQALGYGYVHKLPSGEWAGLRAFAFTVGLVVGLDESGYRTRYCYDNARAALVSLLTWDGRGDPPGPWIKEKGRDLQGRPVDRSNPGLTNAPEGV